MSSPVERVVVKDSYDDIYTFACSQNWTDGLPIVPPTEDRVTQMLGDRPPETVITQLEPQNGEATLECLAVNAVMAGCLPSYFPVVIAAAEAMADPALGMYYVNTTTNSVGLISIVNGPIRHKLEINSSYGCFGPGWRANATIGRAVRFIQLNIAGSVPGAVSKSTMGSPWRYTGVIGENEEKNPWEPLHVERGFRPGDSTISILGVSSFCNVSDIWSRTAEDILTTLASAMHWPSIHVVRKHKGRNLVVLNPDHAAIMHRDGHSKQSIREYLFEHTKRIPLTDFSKPEQEHFIKDGRVFEGTVQGAPSPDSFIIAVAGGNGGLHSLFLPSLSNSAMVTRLIRE